MTGIFVDLNSLEVYRYEKGKYIQLRYAVFAPDDVTTGESKPEISLPEDDEEEEKDDTTEDDTTSGED